MIQGNLFIITAASGAGKTSLVKELLLKDNQIKLSVSHTTRQPRLGEQNGVHYHFVNEVEFLRMLNAGGFLESADVHGAKYGTAQSGVDKALQAGDDVILPARDAARQSWSYGPGSATGAPVARPALRQLRHR